MNAETVKTFSYRISQASRSELVVILYDMASEYLKISVETDSEDEFKKNVQQSIRVVDKLIVGLDMQYEVSVNLYKIYNHIKRSLMKAQIHLDKDEILRVDKLLKKLRTSFYEVSKQDTSGPMMRNTEKVYSGLTYSKGGAGNEMLSDPVKNRGFMA
ncbi:MAG: flagellar protein FliS [Lachnospira sp.]